MAVTDLEMKSFINKDLENCKEKSQGGEIDEAIENSNQSLKLDREAKQVSERYFTDRKRSSSNSNKNTLTITEGY